MPLDVSPGAVPVPVMHFNIFVLVSGVWSMQDTWFQTLENPEFDNQIYEKWHYFSFTTYLTLSKTRAFVTAQFIIITLPRPEISPSSPSPKTK